MNDTDTAITEDEQRRLDAFLQLTRLERGLRAFIEKHLAAIDGPGWLRALPPDVKEKVDEDGIESTDFPDLKKILGSAWGKLSEATEGLKKSQVINHLEGLEPVRNSIAHSRAISEGELSLVQAAYYVLSPMIEGSSVPVELPATDHPQVALGRIRGAINQSSAVGRSDLALLERDELFADVCHAISGYERVRARPGRKPQLMKQVRAQALEVIEQARLSTAGSP